MPLNEDEMLEILDSVVFPEDEPTFCRRLRRFVVSSVRANCERLTEA